MKQIQRTVRSLRKRAARLQRKFRLDPESVCIEMMHACDPFITDRASYEVQLKALSDRVGENYTANVPGLLRQVLATHVSAEGLALL